jgi:Tol biopolymer transport system component
VLFVSDRDGVADIYSIAVNDDGAPGGTPTRLTVGLNVSSFTLSADGSRLAYAVQTTSSNIWSQPFAPSAPNTAPRATQLTFGQQIIEGVAVTKDAQWLYYDSNVSGNPDLYRLHLPSGQPERLTTERSPEFNPSLSPDGRSVAFHSWRTGSRDIFVMPLDGGPVVQVTKTPVQEQHATWSPDGQSLAFASQSQPLGIFIARKDASGTWQTRRRLAEGHWEAWSPDGKSISFATELNGAGGLRVLSVDSGAPRALFDEHAPGAPSAEVSVWSDDGRTIYFKSHTARGAVSIWSVPAAGGVPVHVTDLADGTQTDRFGFGLAQGRVFFVHYDRQSNIWVMDVTH